MTCARIRSRSTAAGRSGSMTGIEPLGEVVMEVVGTSEAEDEILRIRLVDSKCV
jgi:hypothetical protein